MQRYLSLDPSRPWSEDKKVYQADQRYAMSFLPYHSPFLTYNFQDSFHNMRNPAKSLVEPFFDPEEPDTNTLFDRSLFSVITSGMPDDTQKVYSADFVSFMTQKLP